MTFEIPEDFLNDRIREQLEAVVWRAVATKAAHESQQQETLLRDVCRDIRRAQRDQLTVVVHSDFPHTYDFGFAAAVIRSSIVRPGEAYVIPAANELDDLLLDLEVFLD